MGIYPCSQQDILESFTTAEVLFGIEEKLKLNKTYSDKAF